jgi:hypothetical protein
MVALGSLWLPIVVSAVFVFIVSSIIHMLLPYHKSDFAKLPNEREIMDAMRPHAPPPGEYAMPFPSSMKEMSSPEFVEKLNQGPVAFMTVMPNGQQGMGGQLTLWFVYSLIVSLFAGYVASHAVPAGGDYLAVFRFVGAVAFTGYSLALLQNSIWYRRPWSTTLKSVFDGLIYACVTAGTFGWLWPS